MVIFMIQATAKDLRFQVKKLLDAVQRGEEVTITFRGTACAKLVPYSSEENHTTQHSGELAGFGMWSNQPNIEDPVSHVRQLRKTRF